MSKSTAEMKGIQKAAACTYRSDAVSGGEKTVAGCEEATFPDPSHGRGSEMMLEACMQSTR